MSKECKIDLLAAKNLADDHAYKDPHLDLGKEASDGTRSNAVFSIV